MQALFPRASVWYTLFTGNVATPYLRATPLFVPGCSNIYTLILRLLSTMVHPILCVPYNK